MSANIWSSRADVLNDLNKVTKGIAGLSDLDEYFAVGERPPPDRRESIDEDEIRYQFGVLGCGGDSGAGPDLDGISQMLQLVKEDSTFDNEPKTIFRNTMTDEIRISKLNPNVTEFVPSNITCRQLQLKQKMPEKKKCISPTKLNQNNQLDSKVKNGNKNTNESKICGVKKEKDQEITNYLLNEANNSACNSKNSLSKDNVSSNDISLEKKVDVSSMKSTEIEEMKMKMKSKIIDSSGDSIQHKKQKNVAISALLRLYAAAAPAEKPVKLIAPDYYETSPADTKTEAKKEPEVKELTGTVEGSEETLSTSTSSIQAVYKDPFVEESIAKVNDWFDNADSPKAKPEPLPVPPVAAPVAPAPVPLAPSQFRNALSLKKKNTSTLSVNSRKSETSSEKKKQSAVFVPSSYANDLLQKYEKNAKTQEAPKGDWRAALERQLQEKDEKIRKKFRETQAAKSPSSGSGN